MENITEIQVYKYCHNYLGKYNLRISILPIGQYFKVYSLQIETKNNLLKYAQLEECRKFYYRKFKKEILTNEELENILSKLKNKKNCSIKKIRS